VKEGEVHRRESSVEGEGRRRSKRDSGILLMSPFSEHFKNTEEVGKIEEKEKSFDFERMERSLEKVENLMEQNAAQMRSLEHIQAANLERLTAALLQNAELVGGLARGQEGLVHACEELRGVVDKREEDELRRKVMAEKEERESKLMAEKEAKGQKSMAAKAERERKSVSDREEMEKRSRSKEVESQHLTRSQSTMSTATHDTIATLSPCGHVVRRAPRKLGRQVVGYIYANEEHQDVSPMRQEKRRTKGS
jgi:hypothetical protein